MVQKEGNREVRRDVLVYNLDAIISVGYRVNSLRATQFRQWATGVLRTFAIMAEARYSEYQRHHFNILNRIMTIKKKPAELFEEQRVSSLFDPPQAYYWAGPRLGFHLCMMDRGHEHIPEASDTSGWEIAADAVVVQVAADLQEYGYMYRPKFARKAMGFPAGSQLGKKGRPISAQDMREVLRKKLRIDMLPENTHDLSEVFGNEDDEEGGA
ncbi:RhuM family protein [Desulfosporosinus nitroreducens]|uniref:RhuM family protein n=1 Tax=Desulfosporosinus nitroreducens TaxID=2018668 RepID=UPI00403B1901